ncbi:hypothetical protein BGW41_006825 [Actinomortierella wolfii]|nr:hypothetical protein BGW41_006825 [Actinomortierella wolfii]
MMPRCPICPMVGLENNPRVHFQKVFLGKVDKVDAYNNQWKTLQTLMQENGHQWIDILKIDIEGHEYETLHALMDHYDNHGRSNDGNDDSMMASVLPFSQLELELHVETALSMQGRVPKQAMQFADFLRFWRRLESFGLRAFWTEPNLLPTSIWKQPLWYSEYSFINVAGQHPLIED